jgi:hypothetical protein
MKVDHQRKSWSNDYKVSSCSVKGFVGRYTHQSCFKKYFNSLIDKLVIIDIYAFTWWVSVGIGYISYKYLVITKSY